MDRWIVEVYHESVWVGVSLVTPASTLEGIMRAVPREWFAGLSYRTINEEVAMPARFRNVNTNEVIPWDALGV